MATVNGSYTAFGKHLVFQAKIFFGHKKPLRIVAAG